MDLGVGEDAETLKFVAQAREGRLNAFHRAQNSLLGGLGVEKMQPKWNPSDKPTAGESPVFISSQACAQCHAEQYLKWANSRHARSTDALILKKDEGDASCFQCHSTGVQKAGELPKLENVQCEQCHGAGSLHAIKPSKDYGKVTDPKAACTGCHNQQTSANFDFQTAWLKIKH
jgi:hypothetical protein